MKFKRLTIAIGAAILMPVTVVHAGGHASSKGHDHGSKKHASMPKIYGRLDVGLTQHDPDMENEDSYFDVESYASRLGVKGKIDTNIVDMDVIYKYEIELNSFEDEKDTSTDTDMLKARDQYVGVRGTYGQLTLGRHDTAFKKSQGKVDLFGDHAADIKHYMEGEDRVGDSINYVSPDYMGLKASLTLIAGEKNDSGDFISNNAVRDPDTDSSKTNEDYTGVADGASYAVSYTWGDYYFAIAGNSEVKKYDSVRFTSTAKFGDYGVGFLYQDSENSNDSSLEQEAYVLSGYYKMGLAKFKLQYGSSENKDNSGTIQTINAFALGADYKLAKSTTVYGEYTNLGYEDLPDDKPDRDESTIAFGIKHKF